jgi:hypothetical protein
MKYQQTSREEFIPNSGLRFRGSGQFDTAPLDLLIKSTPGDTKALGHFIDMALLDPEDIFNVPTLELREGKNAVTCI